jgi:hypothetical protein
MDREWLGKGQKGSDMEAMSVQLPLYPRGWEGQTQHLLLRSIRICILNVYLLYSGVFDAKLYFPTFLLAPINYKLGGFIMIIPYIQSYIFGPGAMAHVYNPSYLGCWEEEDWDSRPPGQKVSKNPS